MYQSLISLFPFLSARVEVSAHPPETRKGKQICYKVTFFTKLFLNAGHCLKSCSVNYPCKGDDITGITNSLLQSIQLILPSLFQEFIQHTCSETDCTGVVPASRIEAGVFYFVCNLSLLVTSSALLHNRSLAIVYCSTQLPLILIRSQANTHVSDQRNAFF